ncbi:MAG: SIS domain-containing protein [Lachnospiraceae bacterium]|nr:SIS domain-containing protein [Lachnospiraceae bacterium]MCI9342383.1 SIS domain-containing protein [Lachnospiraceae bacterium]
MENIIRKRIQDSINVKQDVLISEDLLETIGVLSEVMTCCIEDGGKLILCGNGGSASDALHFAGEIIGRFQKERVPWPALALNADVAAITAIANDYGFDNVFARQIEGHATNRDIFIGISTSGNSENVYRGAKAAQKAGVKTAALLGMDGGKIGKIVDYPMIVPSTVTARIQECHILLIHILCELIENNLG